MFGNVSVFLLGFDVCCFFFLNTFERNRLFYFFQIKKSKSLRFKVCDQRKNEKGKNKKHRRKI